MNTFVKPHFGFRSDRLKTLDAARLRLRIKGFQADLKLRRALNWTRRRSGGSYRRRIIAYNTVSYVTMLIDQFVIMI